MGTADFLKRQDGKKAYVIGEGALTHELYKAGFTITDIDPTSWWWARPATTTGP